MNSRSEAVKGQIHKTVPRTNDKVSMQRKDNDKRKLEDVENAETNNRSTHEATPILLNNNHSPTQGALGGANACE